MSILTDIFHKIFPSDHPALAGTATGTPGTTGATTSIPAVAPAPAAAMPPVDINAILTQKAAASSEKLNWQTSIVDLLKLLGLDSSLDSRKQLAKELGYTGDTNDSATMNVWLHKEVMAKVAANGGQVPAVLH
jgi:Domain of unknown function (DUF3597)